MKTQCQMIREHLEAGHRLSPIEALDRFGCFRLASRINELRKQGLDIRTDIVEGADNGKRWAEYWLHRDNGFLQAPEPPMKTLPNSPDKDDAMALAMFATGVAKVTVDKEPQAKPRRTRRRAGNMWRTLYDALAGGLQGHVQVRAAEVQPVPNRAEGGMLRQVPEGQAVADQGD